jgi:hypothetical protein
VLFADHFFAKRLFPKSYNHLTFASQYGHIDYVGVRLFYVQRRTTTPALKMACRLASVPVLTVSVLKRLQDLGIFQNVLY